MCRCWVLCLFGLLFPASLSWAAQAGGSVKLRVDVELVTTDVTVVDRKGNPVRNLKKEDFRLYEDGKEQEISNFDEVAENADGTAQAKTVLILFDDGGLLPHEIKSARDSAVKFVKEHMGAQDQFAVASFGMSALRVIQNFTGDREKVLLAASQPVVSVASTNRMEENPVVWQSGSWGQYFPENPLPEIATGRLTYRTTSSPGLWGILDKLSSMLEHLRGPKYVLVYTGGGYASVFIKDNVEFHLVEPRFDFERELDKWTKGLGHYYVLGFQPGNPKRDGAVHKIVVKTDRKDAKLHYQYGYTDQRPIDTLVNSRREKSLLNAMTSPVANGQLPVTFRANYFYASPKSAKVIISARIRTEKLALRKAEGRLGCVLSIMGAAFGEDGAIAARFSEPLHLNITKDKESEFRKTGLAYRNQFRLRPGKYRLKLAVSDEEANVSSTEQSLEVPALLDSGLTVSSLVLVEKLSPLPDLIRTLHAKLLDDGDPFVYAGMQASPSADNRLPVNSSLAVLFKVYGLAGGSENRKLVAKARLVNAIGEELVLPPIPLEGSISQTGDSEATVWIDLPFPSAMPGKYKLMIEISEANATR